MYNKSYKFWCWSRTYPISLRLLDWLVLFFLRILICLSCAICVNDLIFASCWFMVYAVWWLTLAINQGDRRAVWLFNPVSPERGILIFIVGFAHTHTKQDPTKDVFIIMHNFWCITNSVMKLLIRGMIETGWGYDWHDVAEEVFNCMLLTVWEVYFLSPLP